LLKFCCFSIAVWGSLCTSTFIGSTCWKEWSSSSCRWCITALDTRLASTGIPICDVASRHLRSVRRHSLPRCASTQSQLVWASGICCCRPKCLELAHWVMICVIRHLALTVSDVCFKLGYFQNTSKVNEGNKARLNILRNKILSSANIGKLSNVGVSFYQ